MAPPGSSGGGGEGGEEGEEEDETEEDIAFSLTCNGYASRGDMVRCAVDREGGPDIAEEEIGYDWSGSGSNTLEGSGTGSSWWSGRATSTVTISVSVDAPGQDEVSLSETITVGSRGGWALEPFFALERFANLGGSSEVVYGSFTHTTDDPTVTSGSGPWEGEYIADDPPGVDGDIRVHSDLSSNGRRYSDANTACTKMGSILRADLYDVNRRCGTTAGFNSLYSIVSAHEAKHMESGNDCINSNTTGGVMAQLEAMTGSSRRDLEARVRGRWMWYYSTYLRDAITSRISSSATTSQVYTYRQYGTDEWTLGYVSIAGHSNGTWGC